jgi:sulfate permease, SulP family
VTAKPTFKQELKGAIAATLQGLINVIGPLLLFSSLLGPHAQAAGFWAMVVTATLVHLVAIALRGQAAVLPSSRTASLVAYIGLVMQLALASSVQTGSGQDLGLPQIMLGLAAGSLMFLLASALVVLVGLLKLGNVFKMIPTPVTAGISTGIALVLVALAVRKVSLGSWWPAFTAGVMLLAYLLWPAVVQRARALRAIPPIVIAPVLGATIAFLVEPLSMPSMPSILVLTSFSSNELWNWLPLQLWPLLAGQDFTKLAAVGLPGAVTLALVMILETFTAAATMETRFGVRINANRELLVLGGANLVSALAGGVPSTGSPVRSVSSWLDGGRGVTASVMTLLLSGVLIAVLSAWLLVLPAGVVAGLFLVQAVIMFDPAFLRRLKSMARARQWRITGTQDLGFWITLAISLVTFFGNLVWACCIGVALSCLAVLRRVSINLTAHWAYLDQYRSRRVRSAGEVSNLARTFHRVGVLRLTGHLFFGNSARLMQLADDLHPEAKAVVIDVSEVHEVDPSGVEAVSWLIRALIERHLKVVVTGLKRTRAAQLRFRLQAAEGVQHRTDLDRGLEACEDGVLMNSTVMTGGLMSQALAQNSLLQGLADDEITAVLLLGETREFAQGAVLFRKDAPANGIWLLESGVVSILTGEGDNAIRLATFGPGQFVGEMGFIDGKNRSATAWADSPVQALLLDSVAIAELLASEPEVALKITRNIARELSHRVRLSTALMADKAADSSSVWANQSLENPSQL